MIIIPINEQKCIIYAHLSMFKIECFSDYFLDLQL